MHKRIHRFRRRGFRVVLIVCLSICFALVAETAVAPARHDPLVVHGIGIALTVITGYFLIRSFCMATIDIQPDKVVVRDLLR